MEKINEIWILYGQPIVSSALFSAICTAIICGVIKGVMNRRFSKLNVDDEFNKVADAALERFKGMTFNHDIEPIVESKLAEIKQELTSEVKDNLDVIIRLELGLSQLINDFTKYFDNSSAIPKETKDQFLADLKEVQELVESTKEKIVESTPVIEEKEEKHHKKQVER